MKNITSLRLCQPIDGQPHTNTTHGPIAHIHTRIIFFFFSLYPGTLCRYLMPYRDFICLDEENPTILFREMQANLLAHNWEYFADLATIQKKSCLVVCDVDYDRQVGLANGIDLSFFPRFKVSNFQSVTKQQAERARLLKRNLDREPAKLTSTNICGTMSDFVDALCFMNTMLSLKITRVHRIICFTQADLFGPFIDFLQSVRGRSPSPVFGKIVKSIG